MLIIGEKINATARRVAEAIGHRDAPFLQELARHQVEAGAHYLDVNAGRGQGSEQEAEDLKWAIDAVQAATYVPLAIDSSDSQAIKAALAHYRGNAAIINSVNAEEEKLKVLLPLALEHQANVIALAMDYSGVPKDVEGRLRACDRILERAVAYGVPLERIFLDPLALPLAVDTDQGMVTLRTLEQIKARWPQAKTTLGLSNASRLAAEGRDKSGAFAHGHLPGLGLGYPGSPGCKADGSYQGSTGGSGQGPLLQGLPQQLPQRQDKGVGHAQGGRFGPQDIREAEPRPDGAHPWCLYGDPAPSRHHVLQPGGGGHLLQLWGRGHR